MKTRKLWILGLAAAFTVCIDGAAVAEEKTASEKTAEVWDQTKKATKETTDAVVKKTKEAVAAVEHKIDQPDADARTIKVQVSETGVQMPNSLPAGKTAFVVKNTGKEKHNFEIEGEHLDKGFWFSIAPGDSKTMQVELKPGSYEADCSVDGHAEKEGKVKLTVK